jgi:hypothetical protein
VGVLNLMRSSISNIFGAMPRPKNPGSVLGEETGWEADLLSML